MAEDFLYYLWQYHKFSHHELLTSDGKQVTVTYPGYRNFDSGPDFSEAKVRIDNIEWCGHVEMHVKTSDWFEHNHQDDPAYNNVVLHIVWEHDTNVSRPDGTYMPTIALKDYVDISLLSKYQQLIENIEPVPCGRNHESIPQIKWISMLDRCAVQRLERKSEQILKSLEENNGDWEETTYQVTLKYLGFKVNAFPMEQLSRMLPYKVLKKNIHQPQVVEALLFGQAGMLSNNRDEYVRKLKKEYNFYKIKYSLEEPLDPHLWKFLRMRPANFPSLRLAQFSSIVINNLHLFDLFLYENEYKVIEGQLRQKLNPFWNSHYHFNKKVKEYNPTLGKQAVQLLIINLIAPLRAAYANFIQADKYMDSAIALLQQLPTEKNKITKVYDTFSFEKKTAFDSQALITLFEDYCSKKQCLNCDIGLSILK